MRELPDHQMRIGNDLLQFYIDAGLLQIYFYEIFATIFVTKKNKIKFCHKSCDIFFKLKFLSQDGQRLISRVSSYSQLF